MPGRYAENPDLGQWLRHVREFKRRGELSAQRIAQLEALGVVWDRRDARWEQKCQALADFKTRRGHCNVTRADTEDEQLRAWLDSARQDRKGGRLSDERIAQLDALGVVWDPQEAQWERMCQALAIFKAREGHCDVSLGDPENGRLAMWLQNRRQDRKRGRLSGEHVAQLEALGVEWDDRRDARWEQMYQALADFKARKGHCSVPRGDPEHARLAEWLGTQRGKQRRGTLFPDRLAKLETLGLAWDPHYETWEDRFRELTAFKMQHGHCDVDCAEHRELVSWLGEQRRTKRRGKLSPDRLVRLEALGVVWEPKVTRRGRPAAASRQE